MEFVDLCSCGEPIDHTNFGNRCPVCQKQYPEPE